MRLAGRGCGTTRCVLKGFRKTNQGGQHGQGSSLQGTPRTGRRDHRAWSDGRRQLPGVQGTRLRDHLGRRVHVVREPARLAGHQRADPDRAFDYVRNIALATDLPVFADVDNGYGTAVNVIRTVREMEAAGRGGNHARGPGHLRSGARCSRETDRSSRSTRWSGRSRPRWTPELTTTWCWSDERTRCGAGLNVDQAIERAHAYVEAEADAIIPISKKWENLEQFARRSKLGVPLDHGADSCSHVTTSLLDDIGSS